MSPCPIFFVSQMSFPAQFQLFCPTHQLGHPCLPESWSLLSKRFLTACLFQFPPSYLWLYFLCLFLFHRKSHFAYHHTVLLCNTLIHYYLTITHSVSAHRIIYLGAFSATFIRHPVFIFLLEISINNRQIHPLFQNSQPLILPYFLFQYRTSPLFPHFLCFPCPLRSAPRTILSSFGTLSINPSRSPHKSFSPPCCC